MINPHRKSLFESTEDIENKSNAGYYFALGKFLSKHADVEWALNRLVRHYYDIDEQTANLIFQSLGVDLALQHILRFRGAGRIPEDDIPEIDALKEQINVISRFRNDLVHYGIDYQDDNEEYVISNHDFTFKEPRTHRVTPAILLGAYRDLAKIFIRIRLLLNPAIREHTYLTFFDILNEVWQSVSGRPARRAPQGSASR
jgi:hypothetical protein